MPYTPPAPDAVNFNFTGATYTPPAPDAVNFNFTDAPEGGASGEGSRKPRPWQRGSIRGNSFKR